MLLVMLVIISLIFVVVYSLEVLCSLGITRDFVFLRDHSEVLCSFEITRGYVYPSEGIGSSGRKRLITLLQ